jgi:hypothetical protein
MDNSYSKCPKCGHVLPQPLPASASCPACGIYFFKWQQQPATSIPSGNHDESIFNKEGYVAFLLQPIEKMDSVSFYGRCVALALLVLWSWFLINYDYPTAEINTSFMHNILLPIHEAGHVLFIPFGEFMTILGGSLFQVMLPMGIGIGFIWKNRDNFGAAIGLWWASVSLVDLSPYIYDALHPQLILIGGHTGEDGPHDWIYLLTALGQIRNAQWFGMLVHTFGALFMISALTWALAVLWRQKRVCADLV